jgi:hypothetical protein
VLTEDDVVAAVCIELENRGWSIESRLLTTQRGPDIQATKGQEKLLVEAKGEGSSKAHSSRYGMPFTRNQVRTHIGVAILTALKVAARQQELAGIALPDNAHHHEVLGDAKLPLLQTGVAIFWTSERTVQVEGL